MKVDFSIKENWMDVAIVPAICIQQRITQFGSKQFWLFSFTVQHFEQLAWSNWHVINADAKTISFIVYSFQERNATDLDRLKLVSIVVGLPYLYILHMNISSSLFLILTIFFGSEHELVTITMTRWMLVILFNKTHLVSLQHILLKNSY